LQIEKPCGSLPFFNLQFAICNSLLPVKEDNAVRKLGHRYQRSVARPVEVEGVGYLTGARVRLRFAPAPPGAGVAFVRTDLGPQARLPATVDYVTGTQRRTTLGSGPLSVGLVEHVLAALAGLRIDNCTLELNGPEPPGLDGSAEAFVAALHRAGVTLQPARRTVWTVDRPLVVGQHGATVALFPADDGELRVSYLLDYGCWTPLPRQTHTVCLTPEGFVNEIAHCRTFLLESEAHELRRQGLGRHTKVTDLVVFGPRGPIDNRLRHANEPARHKILDLVGDLSLLGHDVRGRLVAYRSGHPLNVELVRALAARLPQQVAERRCAA
jgi:UDP-3-O-acyl N-acetylglucosamine deacetylase